MTILSTPETRLGPVLTTSNGTVLYETRVLIGGRSHRLHQARHAGTGQTVIVKTGGDPAKLAHEARVLAALAAIPETPCPRLLETSQICTGAAIEPGLILEYINGHHPHSLNDYRQLGMTLAELHAVPLTDPLRSLRERPTQLLRPARSIAATVSPALSDLIDRLTPPGEQHWPNEVLTHGDLAVANTLTSSRRCVLIDYENAVLAHPGLDLGRIIFLTHLTTAPLRRKQQRIRAFLTSYAHHRQIPYDLTAWVITAGLQVAAWRQTHRIHAHVPPLEPVLDELRFWAARPERIASPDEAGEAVSGSTTHPEPEPLREPLMASPGPLGYARLSRASIRPAGPGRARRARR